MENEVIMLVLGIGVVVLVTMNMDYIRRIRYWKILLTSFYILVVGFLFTVLEGFYLEKLLNLFEHASYVLSSVLMTVWAWKSTSREN